MTNVPNHDAGKDLPELPLGGGEKVNSGLGLYACINVVQTNNH